MKKSFKQKLDLNSDQIQRLTKSEAKKVMGGVADSTATTETTIDWSTFTWKTDSIDWEGTRSWPW